MEKVWNEIWETWLRTNVYFYVFMNDMSTQDIIVVQQQSIPVGCVSPAFLVLAGGLPTPCTQTPPPQWMQTDPLDAGHVTCDACWEAALRPTSVNRKTDTCKNVTLPQTSFAGGNKPHGPLYNGWKLMRQVTKLEGLKWNRAKTLLMLQIS